MNGVELLEQVFARRESGEVTACQTCVSKCLSTKLDTGDKATDQDQAICFSECGCSKEGTEQQTKQDAISFIKKVKQNKNPDDIPQTDSEWIFLLQRSGFSNRVLFDALDALGMESKATEQDIISKCKTCGFTGGMKDIIKHSDDTGHDDIELMGATKEINLIEEVDNEDVEIARKWNGAGEFQRQKMLQRSGHSGVGSDGGPPLVKMSFQKLPRSVQEDVIEFDIGGENCGCKFNKFCGESVKRLEKKHGREVAFMVGTIVATEGKKIKGTLAYAGVSHNNRLYLPEELQKGDEMNLPMIFNHASPDGAEFELSRLPNQIRESILNHEHIRVGDVKLHWDAENLTLFYEGEVNDDFFAKEIDQGLMSVSLGMLFDADSPEICDQECYTAVKGAEFTEVSLVYHPGFPIATIESNEKRLKKRITPRRYKL